MYNSENNDKKEQINSEDAGAENGNNYGATAQDAFGNATPRATSDSEMTARDIKEGRLSGFVGSGTILNGELDFRAMARVDGHLTGKVSSEKGTLIIGASGQVDADISVATAIINGTVNGDINTSEHLELKRTAKVVGNIKTPRLIMEDGAVLEGNCSMLKAEEKSENRNARQVAATTIPTAKSIPFAARGGENQTRDKKPFETVERSDESSKLTLEVA